MPSQKFRVLWKSGASKRGQVDLDVFVLLKNRRLVNSTLKKSRRPALGQWIITDDDTKEFTVEQALESLTKIRDFFDAHPEALPFSDIVLDELAAPIKALRKIPKQSRLRVMVAEPEAEVKSAKRPTIRKPGRTARTARAAKPKAVPSLAVPRTDGENPAALKMSKSILAAVEKAMTLHGAELNFEQFIAQQLASPTLKAAIANVKPRHPGWSDAWVKLHVCYSHLANPIVSWQTRGTARRIAHNDLSEFVRFWQMHVRCAALGHRAEGDEFDDEFTDVWPLLAALAIGDRQVIDRYREIATYPLVKGHPGARAIYNGVHAILRRDDAGMKFLATVKAAKSPAWLAGLIDALRAIAREDARAFAAGLDKHLTNYSQRGYDPLEGAISLEALGLVRLADRVSSEIVSEFDLDRGPPWDAPLFLWTLTHEPDLQLRHFGRCPKEVAQALLTLRRPPWIG